MKFSEIINGYLAQRAWDASTLSRLAFWQDQIGPDTEFESITETDVDDAIVALKTRGRLLGGNGVQTKRTGKPLAPSTVNRYIKQGQQLATFARRQRVIPRTAVTAFDRCELEREQIHHDRYYTADDVGRLVATARVVDRRWGRMAVLITLAFQTGLRKANLLSIRWQDIDLDARTLYIPMTKNGAPITAGLSRDCVAALKSLPGDRQPQALVFGNRYGKPYDIRRLWERCQRQTGLNDGRTFHSLRHGFGYTAAQSGAGQAQIMGLMGHRSLGASQRYMHSSVGDKLTAIDRMFD